MTPGEIRWADLISRSAPFTAITPNKLYYSWLFSNGGVSRSSTPWTGELSLFSVKYSADISVKKVTSRLLLRWFSPVVGRWIEKEVSVRRPYYRLNDSEILLPREPLRTFVRFPSEAGPKVVPWAIGPKTEGAALTRPRTERSSSTSTPAPAEVLELARRVVRNHTRRESVSPKRFETPTNGPVLKMQEFPNEFFYGDFVNAITTSNREVEFSQRFITKTPNFSALSPKDYPDNPYSLTRRVTHRTPCLQRIVLSINNLPQIFVGPLDGDFWPVPAANLSHSDAAYNKALSRVIDKGGLEVANLALNVVQFQQLDKLISTNVGRIVSAAKDVKRGRFSSASQILFHGRPDRSGRLSKTKSLSQNWLELQYGWKPLLADIAGSIEKANRLAVQSSEVVRVRAKGSALVESSVSITAPFNTAISGVDEFEVGRLLTTRSSRCTIGLSYSYDDHTKAYLGQLGFTNPLNIAWEVIPFSFVADWLLPIGPYLESLTAFEGLKFSRGYISRKTIEETTADIWSDTEKPMTGGTASITCRGEYYRNAVQFDRTPLTSFPTMAAPTFRNPLTFSRGLNALALARVVFGR